MPRIDPMPLISPPESVTVDTGHLHTAIHAVGNAIRNGHDPFRYQIVAAVNYLKPLLSIPGILDQLTVEVQAEPLWWIIQAADEIGNDRCMSPIGILFTAVDELGVDLIRQAPATDRGMTAVLEAETTIALAEAREDQP